MTEYIKNYQKLLELEDINEKEITKNEQIIRENYQKWSNTKEQEKKLNKEIKKLKEEYNSLIIEEEDGFLIYFGIGGVGVLFLLTILAFICKIELILFAIIPLSILHYITVTTLRFIAKTTSVFEKYFCKKINISNLLEQIDTKEKDLSDIKKLCDEYSQQLIKYRDESKKLEKKKIWIIDSINELMRNYATPIFEEQLKNIDEEAPEISKPKTKKKVKINE